MSINIRGFIKNFNMKKIYKIVNAALIFILIGVFLCSCFADMGYAYNIALRVPLLAHDPRLKDTFKALSPIARLQKINLAADPQPKAVLFDFDGTLADTMPQVGRAFGKIYYWITNAASNEPSDREFNLGNEYLARNPWKTPLGHIIDIIAQSGHPKATLLATMRRLAKKYNIPNSNFTGDNLAFGFALIYEAALLDEFEHEPPKLSSGSLQFLRALKKAGIPAYIGTGTPQRVIEIIVQRLGIKDYLDAIYGTSIEEAIAFSKSKNDILRKIKEDLRIQKDNQLIIFGDAAGDMEASKARNKFIAVGVTGNNNRIARSLIEGGADFLIPDFEGWRFYCEQLGLSELSRLEVESQEENAANFPNQFVRVFAVKGAQSGQISFEHFIPRPFNSSIISAVNNVQPIKPLSGYSFNKSLPELFPVMHYALKTEDIGSFDSIVSGIVDSMTLNEEEKKEAFRTIIAWSKLFPTSVKGGRYHTYSYDHFAAEVKDYQRQRPNRRNIAIGVFGSGDGVGTFQDRNMLTILGVTGPTFTQFERDEKAIARSKLFNPQDIYVCGDLSDLDIKTKEQYRAKFDFIYIRNVLHEIFAIYGEEGVKRVLKTANEFLKPNGRLLFHDGVYPQGGESYVRLRFKTEEVRRAFEDFVELSEWKIDVFDRRHDGTVLLRYGDAAKFLTKIKFFLDKDWRAHYPQKIELQQLYPFASTKDYIRYLTESGFGVESFSLGTEEEYLRQWQAYVDILPASQFNSLSKETAKRLQQDTGKTSRGIRYEEYGDPKGIPLILIPGIDGITEVYSSQLDFFKESGFRIIAYYLPIVEEAMAKGKEYSFEFIVQDLCEVMDELGIEKSHVAGTSFGSFVAQQFKIQHPGKVDRLVLVSSAAYLELPWLVSKLAKIVPRLPLPISAWLFARDVISNQDSGFRKKREEYRRGIMGRTARNTIAERVKLGNQFSSSRADLQEIRGDVLIIYGEYDKFMGKRDALRLENALTNANVEVISLPAGHFPQWNAPTAFNREVCRFL